MSGYWLVNRGYFSVYLFICVQRTDWGLMFPWYDLNSLTFTLSTAASRSLVSGHAQCHQNKFPPPRRTPLLLRGCRVKRCLKEPALGVISAWASDTVAASDQTQTAQSCRRCLNMHVYILLTQLVYFVFDIKIVAFWVCKVQNNKLIKSFYCSFFQWFFQLLALAGGDPLAY